MLMMSPRHEIDDESTYGAAGILKERRSYIWDVVCHAGEDRLRVEVSRKQGSCHTCEILWSVSGSWTIGRVSERQALYLSLFDYSRPERMHIVFGSLLEHDILFLSGGWGGNLTTRKLRYRSWRVPE